MRGEPKSWVDRSACVGATRDLTCIIDDDGGGVEPPEGSEILELSVFEQACSIDLISGAAAAREKAVRIDRIDL